MVLVRSEKGLRGRKAGREAWVWLRAGPRGERLGWLVFLVFFFLLLKSSFEIQSGSGEDGREALTSEPQREVAGDSLRRSPPRGRVGLGFSLVCVITGLGDLAPHDACFSCLELVRPLVFPSPVHF